MSDNKLAYSQDTSMELSEQDLDAVAGGVAGVNIGVDALAQGNLDAFTKTNTTTNSISQGPVSVAVGAGVGVAVSVNNPFSPSL